MMDEDQGFLKKISCISKRSFFMPCLIILVITVSKMCLSTMNTTEILPIRNQLPSEDVRSVSDGLFKLSAISRQIPAQRFSDYWKKVDCKNAEGDKFSGQVELERTEAEATNVRELLLPEKERFKNVANAIRFEASHSTTIQSQSESHEASSTEEQFQTYAEGVDNFKEIIASRLKKGYINMKTKSSLLSFNERRSLLTNTLPYNPEDVDLMGLEPFPYIKSYKNPCWLEKAIGDNYTESFYTARRDVRQELRIMTQIFKHRQDIGDFHRVRCLPYFLIIGQPKSGSTDLYRKIIAHPEVRNLPPALKEPHWWARARLGRHSARGHVVALDSYIDLFDHVSYQIEMDYTLDDSGNVFHHLVTGEGSMSTFWDNDHWWTMIGNENLTEPRVLIPDYIRHLLPDVKLILILRNPTSRMYSDFLYFRKDRKSPGEFHEAVINAVNLYQDCIRTEPVRTCVYNYFLNFKAQIRLRVGLYSVFLKDWLRVFPREQIFIIRTEDYADDPRAALRELFHFMELRKLSSDEEDMIVSLKRANTRRTGDLKYGDMLLQTKAVLDTFYKPFNEELAEILNDESFLWQDKLF